MRRERKKLKEKPPVDENFCMPSNDEDKANMFETMSKEIKKRLHIYNAISSGWLLSWHVSAAADSWSLTSERWQIDGNSNGFRCNGKREYMCEGGVSVFSVVE